MKYRVPEELTERPEGPLEGIKYIHLVHYIQPTLIPFLQSKGIQVWLRPGLLEGTLEVGIPEGSTFYGTAGIRGWMVKVKSSYFLLTNETITWFAPEEVE